MNFTEVAQEVGNWVSANPAGTVAIVAGFAAATVLTYKFAKPYFAPPTPTGFDNPAVKAARERKLELMQQLGLGQPKEP